MKKFSCIILAAGSGTRYGEKKQFALLNGMEIWEYSLKAAQAVSDEVIVVGLNIPGGNTRQESVKIGLDRVTSERVVILDAARPLVTSEQISLIGSHDSPSISYGIPSADTILLNKKYLDRNNLTRLQVPQAFDTKLLLEAHNKTSMTNATDDCQLMQEVHGLDPEILLGGQNLHKLTYPEDLKILEHLCKLP